MHNKVDKSLFFILFLIVIHGNSTFGFAAFARAAMEQTFFKPVTLAYLYGLRTYERPLEDGTMQQLHAGSDCHVKIPYEKQQIKDFDEYIKQQDRQSCYLLTEDMHKNGWDMFGYKPEWMVIRLKNKYKEIKQKLKKCAGYDLEEFSGGFLQDSFRVLSRNNIKNTNLEFRSVLVPDFVLDGGRIQNDIPINKMLLRIEAYAEEFRDVAIKTKLLTEKDFEPLRVLRNQLESHGTKTVYQLYKEQGYDDTETSWAHLMGGKEGPIKDMCRVTDRLLENAALCKIHNAVEPNIFINMGGYHINNLDEHFRQNGWRSIANSGVNDSVPIAEHVEGLKSKKFTRTVVDVADHFENVQRSHLSFKKPKKDFYARFGVFFKKNPFF